MAIQVVGYDGTFPRVLRELLDRHPVTGKRTTLKELAKAVDVRQQTVSLYKNGETQPTPETLVRIADYFDVSVDYLLTGVSSQNKPIYEELGLSEEAIGMLKRAKETAIIATLNELLSDRGFYDFLEDTDFKVQQLKALFEGKYDTVNIKDLDIEGYYIWDLQKYIEEFILKQLVKRGLSIEERTVKTNALKTEK